VGAPPNGATARIYRPAKTATQSGAGMRDWVLEFEPVHPQYIDSLMGWAGRGDVERQVTLHFPTKEEAVAYAKRHRLDYVVVPEHKPRQKIKSYADNFRTDLVGPRYVH
jgi:hypothetical protein